MTEEFTSLVDSATNAKGAREILTSMLIHYCNIESEPEARVLIDVLDHYHCYDVFKEALVKTCSIPIMELLIAHGADSFASAIQYVNANCKTGKSDAIAFLWNKIDTTERSLLGSPHVDKGTYFQIACEIGYIDAIKTSQPVSIELRLYGLHLACQYGHSDVVEFLLHTIGEADLNGSLTTACRHGHFIVARLLIEHIGEQKVEWDRCLYNACLSNTTDIVNIILEYTETQPQHIPSWYGKGFVGACKSGHLAIAKLMIRMYGYTMPMNYYIDGFKEACYGGHADIVTFILSTSTERIIITPEICYIACKGGSQDIVLQLIEYGGEFPYKEAGVEGACMGDQYHILKLLGTIKLNNDTLYMACRFNDEKLLADSIKSIKLAHGTIDWAKGFIGACHGGHFPLVREMMKYIWFNGGKVDFQEGIDTALSNYQWDVAIDLAYEHP